MRIDPTGLDQVDIYGPQGNGWGLDLGKILKRWGASGWLNPGFFGGIGKAGWCVFNPFKACASDYPDDDDRGTACPGKYQRLDENGVCVDIGPRGGPSYAMDCVRETIGYQACTECCADAFDFENDQCEVNGRFSYDWWTHSGASKGGRRNSSCRYTHARFRSSGDSASVEEHLLPTPHSDPSQIARQLLGCRASTLPWPTCPGERLPACATPLGHRALTRGRLRRDRMYSSALGSQYEARVRPMARLS